MQVSLNELCFLSNILLWIVINLVFVLSPKGLDPYNRRIIWDMIIAAKKDRSIILTTHFLDEADILSDRIGILKNGKLEHVAVHYSSSIHLERAIH